MSALGRSVSTCAIIRTTRGMEPAISSSRAQISGTSPKPSRRAAYAGNSECRSDVAVKITEMKSSTSRPLASMTSVTISATRSSMWSRTSSSSWVAPRTALTATRAGYLARRRCRTAVSANAGVGFPGEPGKPELLGRSFPREVPVSPVHRGNCPTPSPRLIAPERPVVALGVLDAPTAPAVVLVAHRPDDARPGGHRAVEDAVGVVGDEVRRGAADVGDDATGPLAAEHDSAAPGPQPLGVHHDRGVGLVAVGRVLDEADRAQPGDHRVGVAEGHRVPDLHVCCAAHASHSSAAAPPPS